MDPYHPPHGYPEQYIPPHRFYMMPGGPGYGPPPPAPYGPVPPQPAPSQPPAPSPPPSPAAPVKRKRGRPPNPNKAAPAMRAKAAAKVATKKAPPTGRKKPASASQKENIPINVHDGNDSESGDESEGGGERKRYWTDIEKELFFDFLLGQSAESERRFEQNKKDPGHVYQRASEIAFKGKRSAKSIRGLWTRSLEIFTWMVAFEGFTGNGGGDPDSDDPMAVLKQRLDGARRAGISVGKLKPDLISKWQTNGWWDMFNDRLGASAKVTRHVIRNSASALSDTEEDLICDDHIDPSLREQSQTPLPAKTATAAQQNPKGIVSEPKFTPASKFRSQVGSSLGSIGELVKVKAMSEEKKAKALDAKLELDVQKFELEKTRVKLEEDKAKVDMARTVFAMDGASAEVKDAANKYLLTLFN
ncbi:hypothetical protein C8J57DRAFT_1625522 [Mycena rebaudengoi]|nr:hypothetical protein C8J57DRAFT_1625522 [Mycena rebaudengoi]